MALLYDRVPWHRRNQDKKWDTRWNWVFHTPCKSLNGIVVLFDEEQSYIQHDNPKIDTISVIVEGNKVQKHLRLHDLSVIEYLTNKYVLYL